MEKGIKNGYIKIINERAILPITEDVLDIADNNTDYYITSDRKKDIVCQQGDFLRYQMEKLNSLNNVFLKERREYIDICRELKEIIITFVPQGIESDSFVNWQILISDLRVLFDCAFKWQEQYMLIANEKDKKINRINFLKDLRLVTEAISNYYKFVQSVNAQTWQAPVYEIQTQLDAEKLMIAYREFIFQYMKKYKESYSSDIQFYPILYPDMSNKKPSIYAPFHSNTYAQKNLLVCTVPSFEYYGRMYDMLPWILHEASHSFRTMNRKDRNDYIIQIIVRKTYEEVFYRITDNCLVNNQENRLTPLERTLLKHITEAVIAVYKNDELYHEEDDINHIQANLNSFLGRFFPEKRNAAGSRNRNPIINREQQNILSECLGNCHKTIKASNENDPSKEYYPVYRKLCDIFGNGDSDKNDDYMVILKVLYFVSLDEIYKTIKMEVRIYREMCADLYMAASLGLTGFGYCRMMFQYASDISGEYDITWEETVNMHRFRIVESVLSSRLKTSVLSDEEFLSKIEEYCISTIDCLHLNMEKAELYVESQERQDTLVNNFIHVLKSDVRNAFEHIKTHRDIQECLERSIIWGFLEDTALMPEASDQRKIIEKFDSIKSIIESNAHILYRIKYMIYGVFMLFKKEIPTKDYNDYNHLEYNHMRRLYEEFIERMPKVEENSRKVADYFNNPQTAVSITPIEMLENTISFVEHYYYYNRFQIMSSDKVSN